MSLAGPRIPIYNYIAPLAYEVKSLELREKIPAIGRKIFSDKLLKVLQLGEVGLLYSHILPVLNALLNLSLQENAQELAIVPLLGGSIRYNVIQAVLDSRNVSGLQQRGYDAILLVPEENDLPLKERVRRANAYGPDSILISIHCNASGRGNEWRQPQGWSAYTTIGETNADLLASILSVAV